jgi:hypothetical protein
MGPPIGRRGRGYPEKRLGSTVADDRDESEAEMADLTPLDEKLGGLCHWEIVEKTSETIDAADVRQLAYWAVGVQREHVEVVRRASLALAVEEIQQ